MTEQRKTEHGQVYNPPSFADFMDGYARAMLLIGWFVREHTHRNLDGTDVADVADCWGCQQVNAVMRFNEGLERS